MIMPNIHSGILFCWKTHSKKNRKKNHDKLVFLWSWVCVRAVPVIVLTSVPVLPMLVPVLVPVIVPVLWSMVEIMWAMTMLCQCKTSKTLFCVDYCLVWKQLHVTTRYTDDKRLTSHRSEYSCYFWELVLCTRSKREQHLVGIVMGIRVLHIATRAQSTSPPVQQSKCRDQQLKGTPWRDKWIKVHL